MHKIKSKSLPVRLNRPLVLGLFILTLMLGATIGVQAADYSLGIIIGEPTGLSFKINNFPVIGAAWSFRGFIHLHVDFWFFSRTIREPVSWFLGLGGKVRFDVTDGAATDETNSVQVGVRIPVGIQFIFEEQFEVFVELAPGIKLFEGTEFDMDGGIGFRYHFRSRT